MIAYYGPGSSGGRCGDAASPHVGSGERRSTTVIRGTAGGNRGRRRVVDAHQSGHALSPPAATEELHATFIDVGQGDSMFLVFPRGKTMLVDAGGLSAASSFDIGDRVVAPVIRDAGFRRIDYVVLTHGDPDHIGGAAAILRSSVRVKSGKASRCRASRRSPPCATATEAAGARWANVYAGDRLVVDDVEVVARHPRRAEWERQKVRNDEFDRARAEVARRVGAVDRRHRPDGGAATIARGDSAGAPEVLKVPHHGSLTSSAPEFLAALRPQLAIVSAGRGNHSATRPGGAGPLRRRGSGRASHRPRRSGDDGSDEYSIELQTFTGRRLSVR